MSNQPQILYHYTSLETLALILTNKSICFSTLLNVDDIEEAETSDLGLLGKYVYVSCWTDDAEESIAMWQLYTPNMHGVRIQLPVFPFIKHHYRAGEYGFEEDTETYVNFEKLYKENKAMIASSMPKLVPITYTSNEELLRPKTRYGISLDECEKIANGRSCSSENKDVMYRLDVLGKCKSEVWKFQKEWRYWLTMSPCGIKEVKETPVESHLKFARRFEDPKTPPPYDRFFLELSDEAISQMQVVFGPRMTEAEKILAKHLLRGCGLDGKWRDSSLKIR